MYLLRPDYVTINPSDHGVASYEYGKNTSDAIPIAKEDMLHSKYWNPIDMLRGLSPIEVAAIFIDIQSAGNKWNLALMQNSARPAGTWTTDAILSPNVLETMRKDLAAKYAGVKNAGVAPVLHGGLKWS